MPRINTDPRSTMVVIGRRWPRPMYDLMQRFLTWMTGKPLAGQEPMFKMSPWFHLVAMLTLLFGGALASGAAWQQGGHWLLLLPLTMAMTLSASRTLWLTDLHAAAHGSFSGHHQVNRAVGDVVSRVMRVLPWSAYRHSHTQKHHGPGFCSQHGDDDGVFLHWLGIWCGLPKKTLWFRLILGLLSPRTHLTYLIARFRVNLWGSGVWRGIATLIYLGLLGVIGHAAGWWTIIVAWVIPLTIMYQAASILGWAGEHTWFKPKKGTSIVTWHKDVTHARFMGENYPGDAGIMARIRWWLRMIMLHLPCRCLIIPGDLPAHDWHHRFPCRRDWPQAIYVRARAIENGQDFPHETWGLFAAIDRVFTAISNEPSEEAQTPSKNRPSEMMLGM